MDIHISFLAPIGFLALLSESLTVSLVHSSVNMRLPVSWTCNGSSFRVRYSSFPNGFKRCFPIARLGHIFVNWPKECSEKW